MSSSPPAKAEHRHAGGLRPFVALWHRFVSIFRRQKVETPAWKAAQRKAEDEAAMVWEPNRHKHDLQVTSDRKAYVPDENGAVHRVDFRVRGEKARRQVRNTLRMGISECQRLQLEIEEAKRGAGVA